MTDFAVHGSQKVQWHCDLDHERIDHHEITHGEIAALDPHRRHNHHKNKADGNNNRLTKVQKGQGIVCHQRRMFVSAHRRVIAFGLAVFGTEIFHGFKVQQTVDGLLVCIRVLVIHLTAQFHAPFGDGKGKPDIKRNGHNDNGQIGPIKPEKQDARHQEQFQYQWSDRKQHKAQEEINALYATFNNSAQPACFAGDMIAHRQPVNMIKGFKRQHAKRTLPHLGKDRIAQLLQAIRHDARNTIGNR